MRRCPRPAEQVGYAALALDASQQPRTLGTLPAMAIVAGSMLGIGIFIAPPVVAAHVDHPGTFLLLWVAGGLSAMFGALSVAELGAMMPRAGGDYTYLRGAYGPGLAYAAGWLLIFAIFPGSLAAMAVGTATYQFPIILGHAYGLPLALGLAPETFWATAIVLGLTVLNVRGVVISGRAQVLMTVIPIALLLVGSAMVLLTRGVSEGAWSGAAPTPVRETTAQGLAIAFLPVYFAYSGWNAAAYVGGEIHAPDRNLPRALVGGTIAITILYLLLCIGFLAVFSMASLANTGEVGTAAARELFGPAGELVITMMIGLSMLGSINGSVLTGSRITFAMAREQHFPAFAGRLHPRFSTPSAALWLQSGWTLVLVWTQGFEQLVNYASAAMLITGTLTVMAVVVLRRKHPEHARPYRTWGYPLPPLLYAASSLTVLALLAWQSFDASQTDGQELSLVLSLAWFAVALLFYRIVIAPRDRSRTAA